MGEFVLFCNPGDVYRGKPEPEAALEYRKMAIEDYDRLISFEEPYMEFVEKADFTAKAGRKEGRDLNLTLFAMQPIIKVGAVINNFTSSSYLFNPQPVFEGLMLPDLDVIHIVGPQSAKDAAGEIKRFYESYGWAVYVSEGAVIEKIAINANPERFPEPLLVFDPEILLGIAEEKAGYDREKLCFDAL